MTPTNQNQMLLLAPPTFNTTTTIVTTPNNDNFGRNLKIHNDDEYEDMDETDSTTTQNFIMSEQIGRPKVFCCGDGLSVKSLLGRGGGDGSTGGGPNRPGQAVQIITDSQGHHITTSMNESGHQQVGDLMKTNAQSTACSNDNHETDGKGDDVGDGDVDGVDDDNVDIQVGGDDNNTELLCGDEDNNIEGGCGSDSNEMEINFKATMSDDEGVDGRKRGMIGCGMRKGLHLGKMALPSTSSRHNDIIKFVFTDHGIRVISDKEYVV